jgi:hypothetical protein
MQAAKVAGATVSGAVDAVELVCWRCFPYSLLRPAVSRRQVGTLEAEIFARPRAHSYAD